MAQAYERIVAASAPLTTKGVLWINTSVNPYTLNIFINGIWKTIGALYDAEALDIIETTCIDILKDTTDIKASCNSIKKTTEDTKTAIDNLVIPVPPTAEEVAQEVAKSNYALQGEVAKTLDDIKVELPEECSEDEIRSWFGLAPLPTVLDTRGVVDDNGYMHLDITVDENGIATFNS